MTASLIVAGAWTVLACVATAQSKHVLAAIHLTNASVWAACAAVLSVLHA